MNFQFQTSTNAKWIPTCVVLDRLVSTCQVPSDVTVDLGIWRPTTARNAWVSDKYLVVPFPLRKINHDRGKSAPKNFLSRAL